MIGLVKFKKAKRCRFDLSDVTEKESFFRKAQFLFPSPQKRRVFTRAFTLIELLVVILILAVMGAIVTPRYSRYLEKAKFEVQLREVMDLFAFAHEKAISTDSLVTLSFDPSNETFRVKASPPPPNNNQPVSFSDNQSGQQDVSASQAVNAGLQLSDEFRVAGFHTGSSGGGAQELHFSGDGTVEQASLTLTAQTGDAATLTLSPATGRLVREPEESTQTQ